MSFEGCLPSLATIKGQVNIPDGAGGFTLTWTTITSNYKCRVYSAMGMVQMTNTGQNIIRTHKCIGEYKSTIIEGQVLILGSDTYRIILVDAVANKTENHHLEMNLKKENINLA